MQLQLTKRGRRVQVTSFAAASKVCRDYIDSKQLGASRFSGGQIYSENGEYMAVVSYNGKVWPPQAWSPELKPLYVPGV